VNPVYETAREVVTGGWVMGLMTLVFLLFFLAWTAWAWAPRNRQKMIDAAAMPLDGE
jgi:cbb3-type cytochrome oxidase subunit 3